MGPFTNHVDNFLGFFDTPSPLVDKHGHFGNPPPCPCGFFNDPPPLALFPKKFSNYQFIGILKSKHNTSYLWNIKLIHYSQIPDIKSKNVGIIIHMDRGLDPLPPCGQTWTFWEPPSPSAVHMVCRCPLWWDFLGSGTIVCPQDYYQPEKTSAYHDLVN